jgi:hypothetical protein
LLAGCAHAPSIDAGSSGLARGEEELIARLARAERAARLPLALAITEGDRRELFAFDLERRSVRWRVPVPDGQLSLPELHQERVVLRAGSQLTVYDAGSGRVLAHKSLGDATYVGSALSGAVLVVVLRDEHGESSTVRGLDASTLATRYEHALQGEAGRPVAHADTLFVPFQHQSLLAFDARTGTLLHVLRSRDDSLEWASAADKSLLFGGNLVYRLGPNGYSGSQTSAVFERRASFDPKLPVPVSAPQSAYALQTGERSARGRVGLELEISAQEPSGAGLRGERQYLVFHRHVFGFDAGGRLLFARALEADVIASRALDHTLLLANEHGDLMWLSRQDGVTLERVALGVALSSVALPAYEIATEERPPAPDALLQGLLAIARDPDNRLVPSRAFAVRSLLGRPEPFLTSELLTLYEDRATPPELQSVLAEALHARDHGLDALLVALAQRYDFLEGTRPAPLGVVVPPLVEAKEQRALPALLAHLNDPATPARSLSVVIDALDRLGDDSIVKPLLSFMQRYRVDGLAATPEVLERAAVAVLHHGDDAARAALAAIAAQAQTRETYKVALLALLEPPPSAEPTATPVEAIAERSEPLPRSVSQDAIDEAFAPHLGALLACAGGLLERHPKLRESRIAFVLEGDGSAHAVHVAPSHDAFEACAYPTIRSVAFPKHAKSRVLARYALPLRERAGLKAPAATDGKQEFWSGAAKHPRAVKSDAVPWWQSQQPLIRWLEQPIASSKATAGEPRAKTSAQAATQAPAASATAPAPAATPATAAPATITPATAAPASAARPAAAPAAPASQPAVEPSTGDDSGKDADNAAPVDAWWLPEQPAAPPTQP